MIKKKILMNKVASRIDVILSADKTNEKPADCYGKISDAFSGQNKMVVPANEIYPIACDFDKPNLTN